MVAATLEAHFRSMIEMNNAKGAGVRDTDFVPLLHDTIARLSGSQTRAEWAVNTAKAYKANPGISIKLHNVKVDEEEQKVSCKLACENDQGEEIFAKEYWAIFDCGKIKEAIGEGKA